jgi:hypothetical protein
MPRQYRKFANPAFFVQTAARCIKSPFTAATSIRNQGTLAVQIWSETRIYFGGLHHAVALCERAHISESVCLDEASSDLNHRVPTTYDDLYPSSRLIPNAMQNGLGFSPVDRPGDIRPRRPDDSTLNPLSRPSSQKKTQFYEDFRESLPTANRYSKTRQTKWRWRQS